MTNLDAAYEIAEQVCGVCGCPEALPQIRISWCGRLRRSIGTAEEWKGLYDIRLSKRLFALAGWEDCIETVVHEVCHAIDSIVNNRPMSHGDGWKDLMHRCGYPDAQVGWSG